MIKTDVVIIGGGIIGCSIAYYLAKEGVETVLVEKEEIASSASGACDGFIFLQSKNSGIHLELARRGAALYEGLTSELGLDLEYNKCGGIVVAEDQEELDYLTELTKRQREFDLDVQMLSQTQMCRKVQGLATHVEGASFCVEDAQVNPILVTHAFARKARDLGSQMLIGTAVKEVEIAEKGKENLIRSVITGRGKIRAELVVDAAGAESATVAEMIGVHLPVAPRRGQVLVTEQLPRIINHLLMNVSYIRTKFCAAGAFPTKVSGATFEQTKAGNILIGSTREFVGYNKRTTYEGMTSIAANAVKLLPKARGFKVIRSFAGLRPHSPDNLPIIGTLKSSKNFLIASGHGGDGIALAPITGKLVAELIVAGKTSSDISNLSPERFERK